MLGLINRKGEYILEPTYHYLDDSYSQRMIFGGINSTLYARTFNSDSIVNCVHRLINEKEVFSLPYSANIKDITDHFHIDPSIFPKKFTGTALTKRSFIPETDFTLYVVAQPWKRQNSEIIFRPDYIPESYYLTIDLGYRVKKEAVAELTHKILKSFGQNKKNEEGQGHSVNFKRGNRQFIIYYENKRISIHAGVEFADRAK